MKLLAENTIEINLPVSKVYSFVINMENFRNWFPEVINIKSHNSLKHDEVGKKYLETVKIPFKGHQEITLEVVKSEKNKLFITEGEFYPLLPRMIIRFSEKNNITTMTWSMQSRTNSMIFKSLFLPILKKTIKKRAEIGVRNLKTILEG